MNEQSMNEDCGPFPHASLRGRPVAAHKPSFTVGDTVRMPHYATAGGFRVWKIVGAYLGGEKQEATYEMRPLDIHENHPIQVPCIILETHPGIERV